MSRGDSVKVRPHPGTSMKDLLDHINPDIHKNPGIVVIHTGTNGLNRGKLYLNRKQTATLAKNLCRFVRSLPVD